MPKNMRRMLRKLSVIVIRYSDNCLRMSKPCKHCMDCIQILGIRKIYYSNVDGEITYEKVRNMETQHISMSRRILGI